MNNNITEYVCIVLLVIVISGVLGMNIVNLIDRKISDISINLPKINVPKPEIIVNMSDICNPRRSDLPAVRELLEHFSSKIIPTREDLPKDDDISKKLLDKYLKKPTKKTKPKKKKRKINYDESPDLDPSHVVERDSDEYIGSVLGCRPVMGRPVHPDQVSCSMPNFKTSENYYRYYYKYPMVPRMPTIDEQRWLGANYVNYIDTMVPDRDYRVIQTGLKKKVPPVEGSNYIFGFKKKPQYSKPSE